MPPAPLYLERVMGIEPTQSAWKAEVLPLNYTRIVRFDPRAALPAPTRRTTPTRRPLCSALSTVAAAHRQPAIRLTSPHLGAGGRLYVRWRGEDYSTPPAFRPSGRRALRGVLRRVRACVEPLLGSHPPPPWRGREILLWWRGEDYSTPPAFRPSGRRALRGVLRRVRACVEPLLGSHPPRRRAGGKFYSGGGGRIRTSEG